MSNHMKSLRKIKVIGFPFAATRLAQGTARTPEWLTSQRWFRKLKHVDYETVKVQSIDFDRQSEEQQRQTII